MGLQVDWTNAKRKFEQATGKKKPNAKFFGLFHGSGIDGCLRKLEDQLEKEDAKALASALKDLQSEAQDYQAVLVKEEKKDVTADYAAEVKALNATLAKIVAEAKTRADTQQAEIERLAIWDVKAVAAFPLITNYNLGHGIATTKVTIPQMVISQITIDKPPQAFLVAVKQDALIAQQIKMTAMEVLNQYRLEAKKKIEAFDANFAVSLDTKANAAQVKRLQDYCNTVVEAAAVDALQSANKVWDQYTAANAAYRGAKIKLAKSTTCGVVGLLASIGAAIATGGAGVVAVAGMVKTAVTIAAQIYDFAKDIEKTQEDVRKDTATLIERYNAREPSVGSTAAEILNALGVPFTNGIVGLEEHLKMHHAKIGSLQGKGSDLWKTAQGIMSEIRKLDRSPAIDQKKLQKLGVDCDKLITKAGNMALKVKSCGEFQALYLAQAEELKKARMAKLPPRLAAVVEVVGTASEINSLVKDISEIVKALA